MGKERGGLVSSPPTITSGESAGARRDLRGEGQNEREALERLLACLVSPAPIAADVETGEIAVPFRAMGATLAEVTTAAVAAVLEQQETHALLTYRVDLDGWLATEDGLRIWGLLSGVPDAAPLPSGRGDVAGPPIVTSGPDGVAIVVTLIETAMR